MDTDIFRSIAIMVAGLLIAIAWIVVTAINRACRHQWENVGEVTEVQVPMYNEYGRLLDRTLAEYHQTARCSKCGVVRYFEAR